jgi:hypothetical protein
MNEPRSMESSECTVVVSFRSLSKILFVANNLGILLPQVLWAIQRSKGRVVAIELAKMPRPGSVADQIPSNNPLSGQSRVSVLFFSTSTIRKWVIQKKVVLFSTRTCTHLSLISDAMHPLDES